MKAGRKAENKEVWIPYVCQGEVPGSTHGKWVRYDVDGKMVKGWLTDERGTYYFDPVTGLMDGGMVDQSVPRPVNNDDV